MEGFPKAKASVKATEHGSSVEGMINTSAPSTASRTRVVGPANLTYGANPKAPT